MKNQKNGNLNTQIESYFVIFSHIKGWSYLNLKTSFNLSVQVAISFVLHNLYMILLRILMCFLDYELMLDNSLITSSVCVFKLSFLSYYQAWAVEIVMSFAGVIYDSWKQFIKWRCLCLLSWCYTVVQMKPDKNWFIQYFNIF